MDAEAETAPVAVAVAPTAEASAPAAAIVSDAELREAIRASLASMDLAATSVGALRADVAKRLGLDAGALDARKEAITEMIGEEMQASGLFGEAAAISKDRECEAYERVDDGLETPPPKAKRHHRSGKTSRNRDSSQRDRHDFKRGCKRRHGESSKSVQERTPDSIQRPSKRLQTLTAAAPARKMFPEEELFSDSEGSEEVVVHKASSVEDDPDLKPTRRLFADEGPHLQIRIGGKAMKISPKTFASKGCGFYGCERLQVKVGGRRMELQCQISCTVVGSKDWPDA